MVYVFICICVFLCVYNICMLGILQYLPLALHFKLKPSLFCFCDVPTFSSRAILTRAPTVTRPPSLA